MLGISSARLRVARGVGMASPQASQEVMKPSARRLLILLASLLATSSLAAGLLYVFRDNLVYYRTPTDFVEGKVTQGEMVRLGGMVAENSIQNLEGVTVFTVTDFKNRITVHTTASLPSLFKENSGAVAEGQLGSDGVFMASRILAKHDENYRPPATYPDTDTSYTP